MNCFDGSTCPLVCCPLCLLTGTTLHLDGMDAFDAATHCASLTAAERLTRQQQQQQRHSSSGTQQQRHAHASSRPQHGATADVQLQVAAQHGSARGGCPNSTAQH
jgi:hypothetical protein